MARHHSSEDEGPLVDLTANLELHSKRTQRKKKKKQRKSGDWSGNLVDLPLEILTTIITQLRPSHILKLTQTCHRIHDLITEYRESIAREIIDLRYPILAQSFLRPRLLAEVDPSLHPLLTSPRYQKLLDIHKRPYRHIQTADPHLICTCLTCILAWNNLCLAMDLAHWQDDFDNRRPLPAILPGEYPAWNEQLVAKLGAHVQRALADSLWYARLLEQHLDTVVRTLVRLRKANKYAVATENAAMPYEMETDRASTDGFLARKGPPSYEFPFNREQYLNLLKLEAYVPNRRWDYDGLAWMYMPASQHDVDLGRIRGMRERWAKEGA